MFLLHKIIWSSSEFRCSASGRLLELESGDGMVQLSSGNSEGVGESVEATDIAGLEYTEIDFIPSKFAPDMLSGQQPADMQQQQLIECWLVTDWQ